MIDVTGYGGTVKQYQVLIDTRLLRQYNVTLQQVEDAIAQSNANVGGDILPLGSQSHNVRAIGYLGEGVDPLDPANVDQRLRDRGRQAGGHPERRRHHGQRHPDLRQAGRQGRSSATGRGSGSSAANDEDDVVEGIVLMRKYEKSLPVVRGGGEEDEEIEHERLLPKGMHSRSSTSGPTWSTSRRTT